MTIKTTLTSEKEIEITLPAYYKKGHDYIAILDESDVIIVYNGHSYTSVSQGNSNVLADKITEAVGTWEESHAQEFSVEYYKALKMMALPKPEITTEHLNANHK